MFTIEDNLSNFVEVFYNKDLFNKCLNDRINEFELLGYEVNIKDTEDGVMLVLTGGANV